MDGCVLDIGVLKDYLKMLEKMAHWEFPKCGTKLLCAFNFYNQRSANEAIKI